MKNKMLLILMLIPMISMAHPGHEHNMTDILLNPLSWANHGLIITLLVILGIVVVHKIVKKYFSNTIKSFVKR